MKQIYSLNGRPVLGGRVVAVGQDQIKISKPGREEIVTFPVFSLLLENAHTIRARYRMAKEIKNEAISVGDFVVCEVVKFDGVFDPSVVIHKINPEEVEK
jgi:hypothetical protein